MINDRAATNNLPFIQKEKMYNLSTVNPGNNVIR